ncbi:ATP-binding cassette domain-containing protein [Desulfosporosinus sp. Sb-LF]|uniref:energy-coupling factor ABC transporter ATP-binding protein n=1 Tax=Desulfosporosinus sp. Sb-LF TaxID=2560027 RepID=UPI0032B85CA0
MILETQNLAFAYPNGTEILHGVDFSVNSGECVALLGANGCGKTTLFQHFNGLLKPRSGSVLLKGKNLSQWHQNEVFTQVGMVFQDPHDQLFAASVYEDVSYGPKNLGLSASEIQERVESALKQCKMWEQRNHSIHQLSYGQKKRVAIAGVLAMHCDIIVLDEPTAGLDPRTAADLMLTLKGLQVNKGLTTIISTHEVDIVPIYCDRAYVMQEGRIVIEGTPEHIFSDPVLIRGAFLRLPRIAHLWEILKHKEGVISSANPLTIKEAREAFRKL